MWQSGVIAIERAAEREVAAAAIERREGNDDKGDDDAHLKLGEGFMSLINNGGKQTLFASAAAMSCFLFPAHSHRL